MLSLTAEYGSQVFESASRKPDLLHINHSVPDVHRLTELLISWGFDTTYVAVDYSDPEYGERALHGEIRARLQASRAGETVVVEDGGHYVSAADSRVVLSVEQTTIGLQRAVEFHTSPGLPHPVYSISRSSLKLRIEPIVLAVRILEETSSLLARAGRQLLGLSVTVIGYGILGRALAHRLRSAFYCDVRIIESNDVVLSAARAEGFASLRPNDEAEVVECLAASDVVLGATGTDANPDLVLRGVQGEASRRPHCLVSASSREIEFATVREALGRSLVREQFSWGDRYSSDLQQVDVIAAGRPVNFFVPGGASLSAEFADLLNFRLVEALAFGLANRDAAKRVHGWAAPSNGPWVPDDEMLRQWASAYGRTGLAWTSTLSPHPAESFIAGNLQAATAV